MSNPITGAYSETHESKALERNIHDETSKKMGLEVIGSTTQAFAGALFDSAVQTPFNGVAQLFNSHEARTLKVVENKHQSFNSPEWYGQLAGSGVGSLLNYIGLSKGLKLAGNCVKFAGAPATSKVWRPIANVVSAAESGLEKRPFVAAAGIGAFYGGVLTPVNPESKEMGLDRLKNAGLGAASVTTMMVPNALRLSANPTVGRGNPLGEAFALGLGGACAGIVHTEGRLLLNGKEAKDTKGNDLIESMIAYSILGVSLSAYRSIANYEKPVEVKEYESTEKLIATRRPENTRPARSREENIKITEEWNKLVRDADVFIRKTINESAISQESKLRLTQLHRLGYNEIRSNPANNRNFEPYEKHWETMVSLLEIAASRQVLADSATQKAIDAWNKKHPETPAQPGDLVIPNSKPQYPATLEQVQQKSNSLTTNENKGHEAAHVDPAMGYQLFHKPVEPSASDLVPKPTGLRSGFLGQKIRDMEQAMSNPDSPYYAKRANVNTQRQVEQKQNDLAETMCSNKNTDANKKSGGLKLKNTTFDKFGYTAEQANRQAIVHQITSTSKETASGIGAPDELHKHKPEPWDIREEP